MRNRVLITMEGGIIQSIEADDPEPLDVWVVDFDTEGADETDLHTVAGETGLLGGPGVGPIEPGSLAEEWLALADNL